ncbi:MAG: Rne/Rng family ribonuclease [Geminicoccaceae bacterium]|nr:Rne/Rng family ribonuclease [Geminicoccaceae bacterium]
MTKRMLIDATHAEETRVVVVDKDQLCDFDFETSTKKQLKGNIYLAKVTRVEPSLQAAFVDYGGDRHGFLAFSEIHPDYYQIPQADREMLERMEREHAHETGDEGHGDHEGDSETVSDAQESGDGGSSSDEDDAPVADDDGGSADAGADEAEDEDIDDATAAARMEASRREASVTVDAEEETADVVDAQARMRARLIRSYKIQEVIKRRQILLVQVVKEERGNKGAALTTYLSLAGRYCVLMPNTPRGGGISRKIANANDRRRLKSITQEMEVPEGMGLIVRTAGQQRNKSEIKRDYDFLLRQWSDIRETTLESVAPALIYAEGDLIKRAVRDLYSRDIEEVLVEGEASYRVAKRLMQMMMPSRARNVKQYKDELPLFYRYKVEDQLDAMHSPTVYLPSGGSIVIHTTEALTAIDVNSGRSTRERHIDETALKTNLEAADEAARQLRLRDLAGLIVIDFIDMGEMRHQRQVERRFREALKVDRAPSGRQDQHVRPAGTVAPAPAGQPAGAFLAGLSDMFGAGGDPLHRKLRPSGTAPGPGRRYQERDCRAVINSARRCRSLPVEQQARYPGATGGALRHRRVGSGRCRVACAAHGGAIRQAHGRWRGGRGGRVVRIRTCIDAWWGAG